MTHIDLFIFYLKTFHSFVGTILNNGIVNIVTFNFWFYEILIKFLVDDEKLTNTMANNTLKFNAAFTRALQ